MDTYRQPIGKNLGLVRRTVILTGLLISLSHLPARAETGLTNIIDGVNTNAGATFITGNSGPFNALIITNGGSVSNGLGIIGSFTVAHSNSVLVTGSGSVWTNAGVLEIGRTGSYNQLTISMGGLLVSDSAIIGARSTSTGNTVTVTGPGSTWSNGGTVAVGSQGWFHGLTVADGGAILTVNTSISGGSTGRSNLVTVTGSGSILTNSGWLRVGDDGGYATLLISDGGQVYSAAASSGIGYNPAHSNLVIVTDPGSSWTLRPGGGGGLNVGGITGAGSWNGLIISNGGAVYSPLGRVGAGNTNSSSNYAIVTGTGSAWTNAGALTVGLGARDNTLTISDGGLVVNTIGTIGDTESASNNTVIVTGAVSTWSNLSTSTALTVGNRSIGNQLIISNGATVVGLQNLLVGALTNGAGEASQGSVVVTGPGSLLQIAGSVNVGSNTAQLAGSRGSGSLLITDGATLDASTLRAGANNSGWITNDGGIYQFDSATPTINTNSGGNIVLKDGTISFRGVTTANVFGNAIGTGSNQLVNITYLGQNAFRLNSSSNTTAIAQNYMFDTGMGATNYSRLEFVNTGSLWRSAHLTTGSGGELLASNAVARVAATVTNLGSIKVVNSTVTWASNVVVQGSYVSDPSFNIFEGSVHLLDSGTMAGGVGDVFDFQRNLMIESTNNLDFDLSLSTVEFSGGVSHTNAITGSDYGSNTLAIAENFGYRTLQLGAVGDNVFFTNITGAASNALYVWNLDLFGSSNFVANLHAPTSVNIYYAASTENPFNSYLFDQTYVLDGGGLLMPAIPEPSILALLAFTALSLLRRRVRGNN